jgi:signal transduction histidine kinase
LRDQESFRRGALERALVKLIYGRLALVPLLGALALTFIVFEPTVWRRVVVSVVLAALLVISLVELVRYRRKGIEALVVPFNVAAMAVGQSLMAFASGGLFSPLIPVFVVMAVIVSVLCERSTVLLVLGTVQLPAVWMIAFMHTSSWPVASLVPDAFGDASGLEDGALPWVTASLLSIVLSVGARLGIGVRQLFARLFDEAMAERDRSLAMLSEQGQLLTTLSSEIAHELKNPLSSVKGLAALIAKDLEGKAQERMAVLRREVDRMQRVLEEFLNFSRPLVPLALSEVELGQIARDVARLHEGIAGERAVTIAVEQQSASWLRCDPRKIRQVLVNLVQNALDASPRGTNVHIIVEHDADEARVRVLDEGKGVDRDLGERVFEAGVTTKPHGSGLGLAVARSLAEQHDGSLVLRVRERGGTEALLRLPRRRDDEHAEEKAA